MHADFLEDGAGRAVRAGPPEGAQAQQLGAPGGGGADFDAASLRQDDQREHVCGGDPLCGAGRGAEHLLDVQAHLAEAAAQRGEVLPRDLRAGRGVGGLPRGAAEHGGDRAAGRGRDAGRARREQLPEQGGFVFVCLFVLVCGLRHACLDMHVY